jgi:hypothetical protein
MEIEYRYVVYVHIKSFFKKIKEDYLKQTFVNYFHLLYKGHHSVLLKWHLWPYSWLDDTLLEVAY